MLTCKINEQTKEARGSVLHRGSQSECLAYLGFLHLQLGRRQNWNMTVPQGQLLGRRFCTGCSDLLGLTTVLLEDFVLIEEFVHLKGHLQRPLGHWVRKAEQWPCLPFSPGVPVYQQYQ